MKERFHLLDILRGFAALSVVFYHWKHFFYNGIIRGNVSSSEYPLYSIFGIFYDYGYLTVYLFFILSGFIFFFLYSDKIKEKSVSFWNFVVFRFSRLYPLYFLTLIAVLIFQYIIYNKIGKFIVYPENDVYHFILNIFFASSWGLEQGYSFNYPSWSVSVEILLYLIFFIICIFTSKRLFTLLFIIVLGLIMIIIYAPLGIGIFFFFTGGLIHLIYLNVFKLKNIFINIQNIIKLIVAVTVLIFAIVYFALNDNFFIIHAIVFGIIIFGLILIETKWKKDISCIGKFFNNISYSSYLIHFPLQLFFIFFIGEVSSFFLTQEFLILFFSILIVLSIISFNFFEAPMQKLLRNKLIK